jgi:trk system potassium uptake protein TrkH
MQKFEFLEVLFETTSAFGTVGLSTGITPRLALPGKILIMLTMFSGRLGPLTVATAIAQKQHIVQVRYPEEKVMVG